MKRDITSHRDIGAQRQRLYDVRDYGVVGDGAADDTAALQSTIDAGSGKVVAIPVGASFYRITGPLTVPAKTTIILEPGTIIEQVTKHKPVFDLNLVNDVVIDGNSAILRYTGSRAYTSVGTVRGNNTYISSAGVWCAGDRCRIRNLRVSGFTCGVYVSAWDGAAITSYTHPNNIVTDIDVDNVDFGLLVTGQVNLRFSGIRGSYLMATGSPNPPHLVYLSGDPDSGLQASRGTVGSDCAAFDGDPTGDAYSVKGQDGGSMTNMNARNCAGIGNIQDGTRGFRFTGESIDDLGNGDNGSLYMDETPEHCTIDIGITVKDGVTGFRLARLDGMHNVLKLRGRQRQATNADLGDVTVQGNYNTVDVDNVNLQDDGSDYTTGRAAVSMAGGVGNRIVIHRARNYKYAVLWTASPGGDASVHLDGTRCLKASTAPVGSMIANNSPTIHLTRTGRQADSITGAGQTVRVDSSINHIHHVTATTADAFVVNTPLFALSGLELLVTVENASGGAMGVITWGAFVFASAWANPINGARKTVKFAWDGTNWREIAAYRDVRDYTAAGATADATAVNAAIADLPSTGGTIGFPAGTHICGGIVVNKPGVIFRGVGRGATILKTTSGDLITLTSADRFVCRDMRLWSASGGGHLFVVSDLISHGLWEDVTCQQDNTAKSVLQADDAGAATLNYIDCLWQHCDTQHSLSATVPTFNLRGGAINRNRWIGIRPTYSGSYVWLIETTSGSSYANDITIEGITGEVTNGGLVNIKGGRGVRLVDIGIYDLGTTTKDLIKLEASASALQPFGIELNNVRRHGGTLGGGLYDAVITTTSSTPRMRVINCGGATSFQVNANSKRVYVHPTTDVTITNGLLLRVPGRNIMWAVTGDTTLTAEDTGTVILDNKGSATTTLTLPSTVMGLTYTFMCQNAAGEIHVSPAAADKIMGTGITALDNKDLINTTATNAVGDALTIIGDGVDGWWVTNKIGTWDREA